MAERRTWEYGYKYLYDPFHKRDNEIDDNTPQTFHGSLKEAYEFLNEMNKHIAREEHGYAGLNFFYYLIGPKEN